MQESLLMLFLLLLMMQSSLLEKKKNLKWIVRKKNKSNFYHTLLDTISLRASLLEKYLVGPL